LKVKLDKLVSDDGTEAWDIKNGVRPSRRLLYHVLFILFIGQTKLLEESNKMVKDTASRLETTAKDLEDLIVRLIRLFPRASIDVDGFMVLFLAGRGKERACAC